MSHNYTESAYNNNVGYTAAEWLQRPITQIQATYLDEDFRIQRIYRDFDYSIDRYIATSECYPRPVQTFRLYRVRTP